MKGKVPIAPAGTVTVPVPNVAVKVSNIVFCVAVGVGCVGVGLLVTVATTGVLLGTRVGVGRD